MKLRSSFVLVCTFAVSASALEWPQWRGPDRTDLSKETGLLKQWPAEGPKQVWIYKNAGNGYSGPAIVAGKLYTIGTRDGGEVLLCLDAAKGTELWATKLDSIFAGQPKWGDGPRGTPTVDGTKIYALTGAGTLACLNLADGKQVWSRIMQDLGGKTPNWGYTESPLIDGNQVAVTPGGENGAIAALNKQTGEPLWQSKDFTDGAQYASLIPAMINGEKQYVQLTQQHVAGVSAKDGALRWQYNFPGNVAVIPTPIVKDNMVYVTAGYRAGCMLLKIEPENKVSLIYKNNVMGNHHGGVILYKDHLFGHSDKDGGVNGWVCQNFASGEQVWAEKDKLGKGAIGYADGMFYCVEEGSGTVALIEASLNGWNEKGRFKLEPQTTIRSKDGRIWTHPVIVNGKLYLRDQDLIYCYAVK